MVLAGPGAFCLKVRSVLLNSAVVIGVYIVPHSHKSSCVQVVILIVFCFCHIVIVEIVIVFIFIAEYFGPRCFKSRS